MNIENWVPQLFYDLIGRIIPGTLIIVLAYFTLQEPSTAWDNLFVLNSQEKGGTLTQFIPIPVSLIILFGIIGAYVSGALLGGLHYSLEKKFWLFNFDKKPKSKGSAIAKILNKLFSSKVWRIICKPKYDFEDDPNIEQSMSYVYDFILSKDKEIGARLAKMSAERHFCRVLISGSIILFILLFIPIFDHKWPIIFSNIRLSHLLLIGIFFSAKALKRHLVIRSQNLMKNNYPILLKKSEMDLQKIKKDSKS